LYDSLMVTQITLKTEGPHGLPSGRRAEVDPLYRGLIILAVYDSGHATHSRELHSSRARTQRLDEKPTLDRNRGRCQGLRNVRKSSAGGFDWDHPTHPTLQLFGQCPWQESNPWGSVLRVISCVTIRL
jgi:hypothetical protein